MEESERIDSDVKFRQADILKLEGAGNFNFGLIINADCDLAHEKNDGVIAYLPIYSFSEYIEKFWIPEEIKSITNKCKKSLEKIAGKDEEFHDLTNWLRSSDWTEVSQEIIDHHKIKKGEQENIRYCIRKLWICIHRSGTDALKNLYNLEKDPLKHAKAQLKNAKSGLGDAHFMLSSIAGQAGIGYIIRLRRIYSIEESCCFRSKKEYLLSSTSSPIKAYRTARLTPTYKYKAAQMLAHQLSRIGLDDSLTQLNELAVDDLAQELMD
jgi:hypothetical protein